MLDDAECCCGAQLAFESIGNSIFPLVGFVCFPFVVVIIFRWVRNFCIITNWSSKQLVLQTPCNFHGSCWIEIFELRLHGPRLAQLCSKAKQSIVLNMKSFQLLLLGTSQDSPASPSTTGYIVDSVSQHRDSLATVGSWNLHSCFFASQFLRNNLISQHRRVVKDSMEIENVVS